MDEIETIAREFGVDKAAVLALVDQLIALDGHENVYVNDALTPNATTVIRDHLSGTFTAVFPDPCVWCDGNGCQYCEG
jgi:hypothetical protein